MTNAVTTNPVRWGILGTAGITRGSFLPALRFTQGEAYAVGGREPERTRSFAQENGISHAVDGYQALIDHPDVDAVYIPLPNSLHAEWTIAALRAGKPVLCEKPLCVTVAECERVLAVARETGTLLWEAFVFPFQRQMMRVREILDSGQIGNLQSIQSNFHFLLSDRNNIRLHPELGGGALYDLGCYPIHLATQLYGSAPAQAGGLQELAPEGVDLTTECVEYWPDRRLVFSCGMAGPSDTFSRLVCSEGEIRVQNIFHAGPRAAVEIRTADQISVEAAYQEQPSFAPALSHIQAAIRGDEPPLHLAVDESLATQIGLEMARENSHSA